MFKKRVVVEVEEKYYMFWNKLSQDKGCKTMQEFFKKFMKDEWMKEELKKTKNENPIL